MIKHEMHVSYISHKLLWYQIALSDNIRTRNVRNGLSHCLWYILICNLYDDRDLINQKYI